MRAHNLKWLKAEYMHPNVTVSGEVCTNPRLNASHTFVRACVGVRMLAYVVAVRRE